MTPDRLPLDDRGVSTALGYVLSLTITGLLVSGLLMAGGDLVADQREQTTRTELRVVGQHLAADVESADRLARRADAGETVTITSDLPERIVERPYQIALGTDGTRTYAELATTDPDIAVRVWINTELPLDTPTTVKGGDVRITYSAPNLEVTDD